MLIAEPNGWTELWERAQRETNSERLTKILNQMNALLAEFEASTLVRGQASSTLTLSTQLTVQHCDENECCDELT